MDFAQRLPDIGEKHDPEATGDVIKGLRWEGEGFGIGLLAGYIGNLAFLRLLLSGRHHLGHQIRGGDAPPPRPNAKGTVTARSPAPPVTAKICTASVFRASSPTPSGA